MIQQSLELIRRRLNAYLAPGDPAADTWVVLSNVVDHEGRPFGGAENRLIMCLANVEYEVAMSSPGRTAVRTGSVFTSVAAPRFINAWVLFMANFLNERYPDGLDMLSRTIAFFQQNPVFTHATDPQLDANLSKISMEMMNLDLTQLNYVTSMLGAKYVPMVCYKLRMLPFTSDAIQGMTPPVRSTGLPGKE